MQNFRRHFKLLLIMALCSSLVISSLATAGQKVIGAYETKSAATGINAANSSSGGVSPDLPAPAVVGLAVGVLAVGILAATFVAGVVDGWNSIGVVVDETNGMVLDYQAGDFSKFDN